MSSRRFLLTVFCVLAFAVLVMATLGVAEPTTQPKSEAQEAREKSAQKTFHGWTEAFMKEAVRPPKDIELKVIPRGTGGSPVDIIRAHYKVGETSVTVSQIASGLCVKVENIDFDGKDVDQLALATQIAKQYLRDSDHLVLAWSESQEGKKTGHTKRDLEGVRPFLKYLEFEIRGRTLLLYGAKHRDDLTPKSVGWSVTYNYWFTRPADMNELKADVKNSNAKEVLEALLQ